MRKWLKRIFITVFLVGFLLFMLGGIFYWYNRPQLSGSEKLTGLQGRVTITRDQYGIPHIIADKSDLDAFYALGYVHAQDRFWQMEFQRRVVQGSLSEIFGSATIQQDEYLRTWGFYRAAQAAWPALSPQAQQIIESYTAGVNAFIQQKHFPLQIQLLAYQPKPWTVIDSIAWQKMLAWDLQNAWEYKVKNYVAVKQYGTKQLPILFPPYPENAPTILSHADLQQSNLLTASTPDALTATSNTSSAMSTLQQFSAMTTTLRQSLHSEISPGIGSNNWVVSGKWTVSGKPLLANDPHLALQAPAVWYLAELKGPTLHVVGATVPGMPGVVIGHNDHIAWGDTNVNPDTQDLYILPAGAKLTVYDEIIKVRGANTIDYPVMVSDEGPIISHVSSVGKVADQVALKWTALQPGDTTIQSMLEVDYAKDWSSFVNALRDFVVPTQNFVYADVQGNIGYYAPGKIPVRHWDSSMPVTADSQHQWAGFIPFDKLPHVYNPPEGYIVTANNRVVDKEYPYQLTFRWESPAYRAERILQLLQLLKPLDMGKMEKIQNDTVSLLWQNLAPQLLKTMPLDQNSQFALDQLKNWQGDISLQSVPATIFAYWYRQLANLTPPSISALSHWPEPLFIIDQLANNGSYCQRKDAKDCSQYLSKSLQIAMQDLQKDLGRDPKQWQWQNVHQAIFIEQGLGDIEGINLFWNRQIATPGGLYTVNVGTYDISNFQQTDGPSYREIIDLSQLTNSLFIQTLGQSNDPLSNHYQDQMPLWRDGKYLPMEVNANDSSNNKVLILLAR